MGAAERDAGARNGLTASEREWLKERERENRDLKRANEIPPQCVRVLCAEGARPATEVMIDFIEEHRPVYGVEPICEVLPIVPAITTSTARGRLTRSGIPSARSATRVWRENFSVYGSDTLAARLSPHGGGLVHADVVEHDDVAELRAGRNAETPFWKRYRCNDLSCGVSCVRR